MRVEHDPEWLCRVAILNANKVFSLARPRPVTLWPLFLEDKVRSAHPRLKVFFVTKELIGPEENNRCSSDPVEIPATVFSGQLLSLIIQPLPNIGFAFFGQIQIQIRKQ